MTIMLSEMRLARLAWNPVPRGIFSRVRLVSGSVISTGGGERAHALLSRVRVGKEQEVARREREGDEGRVTKLERRADEARRVVAPGDDLRVPCEQDACSKDLKRRGS